MISANANADALAALNILGTTPGGLAPGAILPDLPAWLDTVPQTSARDHLLALTPTLDARPQDAATSVKMAVARFLSTDPGALGEWLITRNQAGQAADILEDAAHSRPDAYFARLHALLSLRRMSAAEAALAAPPTGVDGVAIEIARANFALLSSDALSAAAAWTRALNQAAFDASHNRFIEIARAAASVGATDAAEDAWVGAIRCGRGQVPLYGDLLPVFSSLVAKGRSEDLLAMFRALPPLHDPNAQTRLASPTRPHTVFAAGAPLRGPDILPGACSCQSHSHPLSRRLLPLPTA